MDEGIWEQIKQLHEERRERQATFHLKRNTHLLDNMKKYTDMSDAEVDEFGYFMVAADYFKLPDHRGGAIDPGTHHYRMNGKEHTIGDVPFKHILEQVEKRIKEMPADRRTGMFKQVMADVPGATKNPDWEREAINPNAEPATAFSTSKACNRQLLDDLAVGLGMDDRQKGMIEAQIVYHDAIGDDKRPATVFFGGDTGGKVMGGRLARDHTLADVPNHFCRDQIMDYINQMAEEEKRDIARAAVFSDLDPGEKVAYSTAIAENAKELGRKQKEEGDRLDEIMETHKPKPKTMLEARNILDQENLLDSVPDDNLDLTQRGHYGDLDYSMKRVVKSVVKPGCEKLPSEETLSWPTTVDLDCDQLRACIKRFTHGGIWSIDQFRLALGGVDRANLTKFLEKRGERQGIKSRAFQLGWEFFKRREMLGLNILESSEDDGKQIEEKGKKRKNPAAGDDEPTSGKKAKPVDLTADESDLESKSA
ncbi:hypothetical protein D6D06_07325 [Aureobasidium pullulans]|nr:hypothetical protein D6D06_07325 [Aureobasidium pullulans]